MCGYENTATSHIHTSKKFQEDFNNQIANLCGYLGLNTLKNYYDTKRSEATVDLLSIWVRRKQSLYTDESACMAGQNNPTPPECMVIGTECYDG